MAYTPNYSGYGNSGTSVPNYLGGTGSSLPLRSNSSTLPSPNPGNFLNTILPGSGGATSSALSNVQDLLNGNPSPDITRNTNAYFGANSGMPGSDFIRNRGFDLYNQASDARKQQGLGDLTSLISSVSQPALSAEGLNLTSQGQQNQNNQFYSGQAQQNNQFQQNQQLQDFLAQLQAIGLGNSVVSSNRQSLPNLNV